MRIPHRHRHPASSSAGITLIEVLLAMIVITVAVVGTVGTIAASAKLSGTDEETILASQAAQGLIEEMLAASFHEVFTLYNEAAADDPGGAGSAPGPHFDVPGLEAARGDADGRVGRILFPVPAAAPGSLLETTVDPSFGLPRDLDLADGIDADEHAGDYRLLPVKIQVRWRGQSGDRSIEFATILSAR